MVQDANKSEKGKTSFYRERAQLERHSDHRYILVFGYHRNNVDGLVGRKKRNLLGKLVRSIVERVFFVVAQFMYVKMCYIILWVFTS